eukprot:7212-Eustigmatos_ZCMA.PRE.1
MVCACLFLGVDQALDEPLLHQDDHDGRRQHGQDGRGHDHVPLDVDLAEDGALDAQHHGVHVLAGGHQQRPQ